MPTDWVAWHRRYATEAPFQRRLVLVQGHISDELARAGGDARVIDMCAGDGRALLGVLVADTWPGVTARLVERDPTLVATARERVREAGLLGVEVIEGDASLASMYRDAVPARLVIVCGVFGHLTDAGVERMIGLLPKLCGPDAAVIWTRHRREPDLIAAIMRWFEDAGFTEVASEAIADSYAIVGLVRLRRAPYAFDPDVRLFDFVG